MKKRNKSPKLDLALRPLTGLLAAIGVRPNAVTLAGTLLTLMVPYSFLREEWAAAGLWLLGAGAFDVLDGALARNEGFQGPFGAFWDSTLDRVSEAFVFAGFLLYYGRHQDEGALLLVFGVSILSLLVPYTRARAEGLGVDCQVGILPRPGRVALLALGFFFGKPLWALGAVGGLSLVTVGQRIHRVWERTGRSRR